AAYSPIMILTGGPGVGKTFTTHTIVSLWKAMGKSIALAAPTGRAAQRLSEMTGLEAKTIHRLLEFDPRTRGFKADSDNPLLQTAIIVDEASMLDLFLAYALVKAVSAGAQLLLVGDIDQLPSVGPGSVLADLINSGRVPVVRLTQVFRQAQQSAIITAAHEINRGQYPTIEKINDNPVSDCLWHGGGYQPEHGVQTICELITDLIPKLGFNPATDVQVLCPMSRGLVGTRNLNIVLQELINPKSPDKVEITRGGMTLRVGDRVIQQTNDYQREVFNGDLGIIADIDTVEQEVNVQYGERSVVYDYADLNEITLAWSVSIHKCVAGYGLTAIKGRGLVQVKDVAIGEKVCTGMGGYRQILDHIQTGEKPIVRILTKSGYTIDISIDHPLLVASREELPHFRKASELAPGNFACIDRSGIDGRIVDLPEIRYQKTNNPQKRIQLPTTLTEDLAWALGVIIGDGSYRRGGHGMIDITSQDLEIVNKYKSIFEGFGLNVTVRARKNHYRVYFVSKPLRHWLESLGLNYALASDKKTPHVIFGATEQVRSAYLRGLFDTDGSVGKINTRFTSSSRQLVKDVHSLLLSIGIISVLNSQGERHHKIIVSGPSIIPFFEKVNFVIERKSRLLSVLVERAIKKGKANIDIIPFGTKLINEFKVNLINTQGIKGQGLKANRSRQYYFVNIIARGEMKCTYAHLQKIVNFSSHHGTYLPENIQKTIHTNYFFDEIVSVEYLVQETTMYDLEVDGHHSFTVNGFVCHNSQGSEYPVVILPFYMQHYMMLSRNLLYTGLTRAKKLAIVIGAKKAISLAVRSTNDMQRYTRLQQRLVLLGKSITS
ncbi:AAA family ATPase, partial [Anabaena cylindrica UHCC 0172]|uniref:AAA family ATPase n=1 Tax=Anabaena cylindrica TaxID=1165 RepID=UPI002B204667